MSFKAEVLVDGEWGQNGVVWPDRESAEKAAADLYGRWTLTTGHRAVESDEEPNRPTWDVWLERGRSIVLIPDGLTVTEV